MHCHQAIPAWWLFLLNVDSEDGPLTIESCRSSVTLTSTVSGYAYLAGYVGLNQGITNSETITRSVFDGKLFAPNGKACSGFTIDHAKKK